MYVACLFKPETHGNEQRETGGTIMQAIEHIEVNTGTTPQIRELLRTIVDAAAALARLLPDRELEQRFEFAWGHQFFTLSQNPPFSFW